MATPARVEEPAEGFGPQCQRRPGCRSGREHRGVPETGEHEGDNDGERDRSDRRREQSKYTDEEPSDERDERDHAEYRGQYEEPLGRARLAIR